MSHYIRHRDERRLSIPYAERALRAAEVEVNIRYLFLQEKIERGQKIRARFAEMLWARAIVKFGKRREHLHNLKIMQAGTQRRIDQIIEERKRRRLNE